VTGLDTMAGVDLSSLTWGSFLADNLSSRDDAATSSAVRCSSGARVLVRLPGAGRGAPPAIDSQPQSIGVPPFTLSVCPVIQPASSDAKNAIAAAMSAGRP